VEIQVSAAKRNDKALRHRTRENIFLIGMTSGMSATRDLLVVRYASSVSDAPEKAFGRRGRKCEFAASARASCQIRESGHPPLRFNTPHASKSIKVSNA